MGENLDEMLGVIPAFCFEDRVFAWDFDSCEVPCLRARVWMEKLPVELFLVKTVVSFSAPPKLTLELVLTLFFVVPRDF